MRIRDTERRRFMGGHREPSAAEAATKAKEQDIFNRGAPGAAEPQPNRPSHFYRRTIRGRAETGEIGMPVRARIVLGLASCAMDWGPGKFLAAREDPAGLQCGARGGKVSRSAPSASSALTVIRDERAPNQ